MGELVLLVVAAAWAAVLIPPLLRSRLDNRPNSSVTDFRRQLNKLQSTVPSRASGSMRGMARPLAQSPLYRPAAGGRPGVQSAQLRRGGTRTHGGRTMTAAPVGREATVGPRRRTHGDPTGGQVRPQQHRQAHVARHHMSAGEQIRRRRSNVMFMLALSTGCSLFLAATTKSSAMLYMFAIAFLAFCAYTYMLAQARQRESLTWPSDWMHR
jgi:hypothetical protein